MRIVVIGATGLVGSLLVDELLAGGAQVHAIGRRTSGRGHARFHEHVADPGGWPGLVAATSPDAAVSALGTTWRAAGSEAAFRAVDIDMVTGFAAAARGAGARRMVTVSSVGADAGSRNFYLGVKGEMERRLEALGFDRLDVMRPGLLRGARGGARRLGERVAIAVSPIVDLFLRGPLARYAAIDATVVARAAAACLTRPGPGVHVHENPEILRLAQAGPAALQIGTRIV